MRLLIECTYVFEHPHQNSGIQRVVRNVINNLEHVDSAVECIPIVLQHNQVFQVTRLIPSEHQSKKQRFLNWTTFQHNRCARLVQRIGLRREAIQQRGMFQRSGVLKKLLELVTGALSLMVMVVQKLFAQVSLRFLDTTRKLPMTVQPGDVLVLLDSSWHADFFPLAEELKANGVKIVSVIYDLIPLTHPQFCDEGLVRVFEHWFDWVSNTADGFIAISATISKQVCTEVIKRQGAEPSSERWFDYFHLGSDLDQLNTKTGVRGELKRVLGNPSVYLMVSTIEPRKNHAYLLDAFELLWVENSPATLVFVGKIGWKTEQLIRRIREHPEYQRKLFMFNDLNDRELEYCYSNSRSLVFPSFVEGFGLPLVEAMQRGLPVMASDIPVFREVGGPSIVYFDLAQPSTLTAHVKAFETSGQFPAVGALSQWKWLSWQDSTQQFIQRINHHLKPESGEANHAHRA